MARSTYFRIAIALELMIAMALGMRAYGQAPTQTPPATEQREQLPAITVTGYIVPRVGDGPQPVVTLDKDYIEKRGQFLASPACGRQARNDGAAQQQSVR